MPTVPLPALTFPYKEVQAALVRMHGIALEDVGAFRSRLGALQKGGLLGAENQPGKGQKLDYRIDQFRRLVLAIELTQAGLGPSVVLRLVKDHWQRLNRLINTAEDASMHPAPHNGNEVVLVVRPHLMFDEAGLGISDTTRGKIGSNIEFIFSEERRPARLLLINLSAQMRKFHDALVYFHGRPDRLAEVAPVPKATPRRRR